MIQPTPQSTNITSHHHQHYHDTIHTPIHNHHIPPSPILLWYRPHPNQQTSHPTVTNTTMIPSTPQSTKITSHHLQKYHDTVHTTINKHHIPPSPTLPWYCPHPNQQTSHRTVTNTTMIPSTHHYLLCPSVKPASVHCTITILHWYSLCFSSRNAITWTQTYFIVSPETRFLHIWSLHSCTFTFSLNSNTFSIFQFKNSAIQRKSQHQLVWISPQKQQSVDTGLL